MMHLIHTLEAKRKEVVWSINTEMCLQSNELKLAGISTALHEENEVLQIIKKVAWRHSNQATCFNDTYFEGFEGGLFPLPGPDGFGFGALVGKFGLLLLVPPPPLLPPPPPPLLLPPPLPMVCSFQDLKLDIRFIVRFRILVIQPIHKKGIHVKTQNQECLTKYRQECSIKRRMICFWNDPLESA